MTRWKRSDVTQLTVLEAFSLTFADRGRADDYLMSVTGAPLKIVWAAMVRECNRGLIEYGVNLRGGWLSPEGVERLTELQLNVAKCRQVS